MCVFCVSVCVLCYLCILCVCVFSMYMCVFVFVCVYLCIFLCTVVKNPPADAGAKETRVRSLGREWQSTPLFLPGESHRQRGFGELQNIWSRRVGHDGATEHVFVCMFACVFICVVCIWVCMCVRAHVCVPVR